MASGNGKIGGLVIPFAIRNLLNEERCFWRRPARRAGRRLSMGPPPAFGGRRPHKIPLTHIQKLFESSWYKEKQDALPVYTLLYSSAHFSSMALIA
jgi:hypothetical protein